MTVAAALSTSHPLVKSWSLALCLLSLWLPAALAQDVANYEIPRISQPPVIDGAVGELEWAAASRIVLDIEVEPGENIAAPVTADALIMEDGETLYVAFIAHDPDTSQIRAFLRDHDNVGNSDRIGVVLDTFNDSRRAYVFLVNPYGVQFDAINDEVNNQEDEAWNAIWDSAGRINDDNYTVEMAIPLKQLRFAQGQELQTWGIDFVRHYPRGRSYRISHIPRDRNLSCYLCNISKAQGFESLEAGTNIEIIPTVTGARHETRDPRTDTWETGDFDPEASLDLRWGITQNLYLNATLNPDFSQVEADSTQLDTNTTFSLYYPERRTFFLDGADYFNSYLNLVHTRNIANPDYGLKLTGKEGRHAYGLLTADDTTTSFLIPRALGSSVASLPDQHSEVSVLRYRYDVLDNSSIGAILTDRRGDGYSNTVAGIDGVFQLGASDTLYLQSLRSESEYPDSIQQRYRQSPRLSDDTHVLEYRHRDRRWDWFVTYVDFGEDFRADMGFVNQVDYRKITTRFGHTWRWDRDNFFNRIWFAADWDKTWDQSGLVLEEETEFFIEANGPLQSSYNGLFGGSKTYWNGKYFDEQFNQINIGVRPSADLFLRLYFRLEDIVDFANTRLGRSWRLGPELSYSFGPHLQLNLQHTWQKFNVDGGRLFTARLNDARVSYQFDTRSFLRFTLQHTDQERNPGLYINPVQRTNEELGMQLLYSYKLNPSSRFFIGYSDASFRDDSFSTLEKTGRSVFAKLSYAWQP
ncbi:MAG: hypothetical protein RLZZ385_2657 [Pseudomonadota bacterium]|jgi:hypothetical protein